MCWIPGLCTSGKTVVLPFFYMLLISGLCTSDKTGALPIFLHVFDIWTVFSRQDCGAANTSACVWCLDCVHPARLWFYLFSTCYWYLDCIQPWRLWCYQFFYMCYIPILCTTNKTLTASASNCVWYLDCVQPTRLWGCQFSYMCLISKMCTTDKTVVIPIFLHVFDAWTTACLFTCVWYLDYVQPTRLWGCRFMSWCLDCVQTTRLWCCQIFYMCLISGLYTTE